jgi:hypothetical protein
MLTIFVDQKDINAIALPDGLIEAFVKECINDYLANKVDKKIIVGSELILHYFRVEFKQRNIPVSAFTMSTQAGQFVYLDNMKCKEHPSDFISHFEETLFSLL